MTCYLCRFSLTDVNRRLTYIAYIEVDINKHLLFMSATGRLTELRFFLRSGLTNPYLGWLGLAGCK
jgi:hypothetical protein